MKAIRTRTLSAGWLLAFALVAAACTTTSSADKAGGSEEPVVLRMANGYSSLDYEPAVAYFEDRVAELSEGALRIEVAHEWGALDADYEQQIVDDVALGEADLGWVGTRIFDTMGVLSLQALTAPMLIDNYPLQEAVIESDIPDQMLEGLDDLGVMGLAVLADGLRKPIAVDGPLLGPDDWNGITFQTFPSEGQSAAIRALGAEPTDVVFEALDEGLANGEIEGFEKNLLVYQINAMTDSAPYITANVNLWPQTAAILVNPDRLAALSEQHREWLTTAAADAAGESSVLADQDASLITAVCESGARFADASGADLAALHEALVPAYATLRENPETAGFIDQIQSMKESTPAGDGLTIPEGCTGKAVTPASPGPTESASALNGTYRWTLTAEDALASTTGDIDPASLAAFFPSVVTVTIQDGTWSMSHRAPDGDFVDTSNEEVSIAGDRITFAWRGFPDLNFTYSIDGAGNLHLLPVEPMAPDDQFVWATHPWTKIEGPTPSANPTAELDGTYRWTITEEDAIASPTEDKSPEHLATFPWVFTVTLADGTWTGANIDAAGVRGDFAHDEYTVSGDQIAFQWSAESSTLVFDFSVDGDGNLHLEPVDPMNDGDKFVWATHPWTKIE